MKKKIVLSTIIGLFLIIGIVSIILFNNRIVSTITLDINPSIEINLTKNEKVKKVKALNNDAKNIVDTNLKGKSIDKVIDIITKKVIEKGYVEDNRVMVLICSEGNIKSNDIETKIRDSFNKKEVDSQIIVIDNITKRDKELAKKYNISPAKVAYINSILKENKDISIKDLVNKSVDDLDETKATGYYCPDNYILEGGWCLKEKERIQANQGKVCPNDYYEYNEKCYEEVPIEHTDKFYCREDFKLEGKKCTRTISIDAEPSKYSCPSGEAKTNYEAGLANKNDGIANDIVCVDISRATHPVSPCETHDGTEYTVVGGKCYWHRAPVIVEGCPGKILVNGMCWDDASNIYICEGYRDGKRYSSRSEYCENSIKYIQPTVTEYKCDKDYKLDGNKCLKDEVEDAFNEQVCPSGYSLVNNDRCINYNKIANKENGFVCEGEDTKLKGNTCITYEKIPAKHN